MNHHRDVAESNRSVKILVSTQNMEVIGGVQTLARFLSPHLRERGYEVDYVFPSRSLRKMLNVCGFERKMVDGIEYIQVRSIPHVHLFDQLIAGLSTRTILDHYDIYQAVGGTNLPSIAYMIGGKTYICWVAATFRDERKQIFNPLRPFEFSTRILVYYMNYMLSPLVRYYERRIYHKAAKVLAISKHTARCVRDEYGISEEKICVVPFPIDTSKFRPKSDTRTMANRFILTVGRISDPRKNVRLLLRAFAQVKQRFDNFTLFIIGQKPKDDSLFKFCTELGIRDSTYFLGEVSEDELIDYYRQAELFVLASLQEGLGIVVLESMACGTPVVSTRCGGPEEIITQGYDGYLVENNNIEDLADAICRLLSDDVLRRSMGKRAREKIRQNYSVEKISSKFSRIYRQIYPQLFVQNRCK